MLERKWRAACAAFSLLALCGCAVSFEVGDGERQVIGFFSSTEAESEPQMPAGPAHHFTFYGLWLDDAFRGTSLALGEVDLTVADLRNQWPGETAAPVEHAGDCSGGFGFRWCTLGPRDPARAGAAFDIAVAGLTIGAGARDRHFGIGYHRQVLVEVTNENALVTWPGAATPPDPAHVELEGLLRGSING